MRSFRSCFASAVLLVSIERIHSFSPSPRSNSVSQSSWASRDPAYSSINTSRRYANTIDRPLSSESPRASEFERRMRNLVTEEPARKKRSSQASPPNGKPANVIEIDTLEDYKSVVADEKNRIVVVRFYAPWCRACKAVAPSFYRLARDFADTVKFVEVPVTDTSVNVLIKGLGIPTIPFGHIYHPQAGLVEELRMSRKRFSRFEDALKTYVAGSCGIPDFDYSDPYALIMPNVQP